MNAHDVVLVGRLVDRCPILLPILQEHLDDYDNLLSHVFFGDVVRWLVERYETDSSDANIRCVFDVVESAFAGGRVDDRELIAASFLENLPRARDPAGGGLRDLVGPKLSEHLSRFG